LIEAGPELSSAFIKSGLVDELIIYQAPILLGGPKSALDDIGVTNLNSQVRFKITEITRIPGEVDNLRMTLQARSA
jgi:diaminohydroxyphosphoribosylaminopyrimidine deaminase/5-amino-6-(5-phosphoribosylamino)uracil reductase